MLLCITVIGATGMVENYLFYFPAWGWVSLMLDMEFLWPLIQNTSESPLIRNTRIKVIQNTNNSVILLFPACHPTTICCLLWAVDECDPIKGGSCSRHGPTMGHRGLRRHEESLHGELKKLKLHHTYYYTYYSWRLRCTTLKKIRGPSWQAWNPTKGGSVWVWFPWFNLMPWNIVAQHQPYQCNFISGTAYHSKIVTAPLPIHQSLFPSILIVNYKCDCLTWYRLAKASKKDQLYQSLALQQMWFSIMSISLCVHFLPFSMACLLTRATIVQVHQLKLNLLLVYAFRHWIVSRLFFYVVTKTSH